MSISASVARPSDHETHAGMPPGNGTGDAGTDETIIAAGAPDGGANGAVTDISPNLVNGAAADSTPDVDPGTDAKPTPAAAGAPNMFASAVWLMMASPKHRHLFLEDLQWRLIPPLMLRQFRLFQKDNKPIAFATWALLSDEVAARLGDTGGNGDGGNSGEGDTPRSDIRLRPAEWRSGTRPILVDVVAPFGNAEAVAKFVRETVLGAGRVQSSDDAEAETAAPDS